MANDKIKQDTNCKAKKHEFMVTHWRTQGGQQKAIMVRCKKCLTPLNLEEIESIEWAEENINVP
jgi:hypothetical protein